MLIRVMTMQKHCCWTDFMWKGKLMCCGETLREYFPHIGPERQTIKMTVYSHPVKGSRCFHISKREYDGFVVEETIEDGAYRQLKSVIESILNEFKNKLIAAAEGMKMPVWVIVE